nr:fatty acyl-CoA hydrolase precursor, medium chain-like isoform X1 [Zootoca vivipara]
MSASGKSWLFGVVLCGLSIAGTAAGGQRNDRPKVVTKYGPLQGKLASVKGIDQPVNVFLGVPFAKPPVGALRFSPPQPAEPWSHVRESTSNPPMCLQDLRWMADFGKMLNVTMPDIAVAEDCLYLNVFTPDTKAKLPVMVWIHGGALVLGGAFLYDGSALAAYEKVVVVAIQYRLGLPGFFSTGTSDARGNWGLLDQVASLQWVQENIAHFGGDPNSVTIFGESAGAFSVGIQLLSPLSKGLFHRAISESGVTQLPDLVITHPDVLAQLSNKIANTFGCEASSSALVHCLRSKTEEELITLTAKLTPGFGIIPAVVDGEFIRKAPEELLASKELNTVPYLLGMNNHEYGWVVPAALNISGIAEGMDKETIIATFQQITTSTKFSPESLQIILDEYLGDTKDRAKLRDRFLDMMGDMVFVAPSVEIARYHRDSGAPVYLYEFQCRPSALKHTKPDFVKADHGDEIGFVFGVPFLSSELAALMGKATEAEIELSRKIMKYWSNFARNGNPNGKGLVEWPRYDLNEGYLELNLEQRKAEKLKKNKVDFWLKTLPEKMKKMAEGKEKHGEL